MKYTRKHVVVVFCFLMIGWAAVLSILRLCCRVEMLVLLENQGAAFVYQSDLTGDDPDDDELCIPVDAAGVFHPKRRELSFTQWLWLGSRGDAITPVSCSVPSTETLNMILDNPGEMESIRRISIYAEDVSNVDWDKIRRLENLEVLFVHSYLGVSDDFLSNCSMLPRLTTIMSPHCDYSDSGVYSVSNSDSLELLSVNGEGVTYSGIRSLAHHRHHLEVLLGDECLVTQAEIAEIEHGSTNRVSIHRMGWRGGPVEH